MSKACTLENGVLNLAVLREDSRRELFSILDSIGKDICFVLDPDLNGPLNHVLVDGTAVLKDHGVKDFHAFGKTVKTSCDYVLFLVRPSVRAMRYVAKYIRDLGADKSSSSKKRFHLYYVSRRTLVCDEVLKKEGVFGSLSVGEYKLDLIPFDDDVLTLELDSCFKEFYVDGDKTNLHTVAASLIKLQTVFGMIPHVKYKGNMAKVIYQMMAHFRREQEVAGNPIGVLDPEIDTVVLIDRNVDLVTPMCSPMTYEGLLDEILGITHGFITVDAELIADDDGPSSGNSNRPAQVSVPLNSNDKLYAEVRDYHVERLGMNLQQQAREIRERYDEFRKNRDASISEIREFVKRIPGLKQNYQSLQQHINLAELIKKTTDSKSFRDLKDAENLVLTGETIFEQLEERIGDQEPLLGVLRQFCLQSVAAGGIKTKNYTHLSRELVQTYGFEMMLALSNLEKAGLLSRRDTLWTEASGFGLARKSFRLLNEDVDPRNPRDFAYVSRSHAAGYAPLSARIVESAIKPRGWSAVQEALRQLPGPSGEVSQTTSKNSGDDPTAPAAASKLDNFGSEERKVMLVYYLGGVTYMEIAALRHLSRQPDCPYDIIVATTKIVNGDTLLKSCFDKEVLRFLKL